MHKAKLYKAKLHRAKLHRAKLHRVKLHRAKLHRVKLHRAKLHEPALQKLLHREKHMMGSAWGKMLSGQSSSSSFHHLETIGGLIQIRPHDSLSPSCLREQSKAYLAARGLRCLLCKKVLFSCSSKGEPTVFVLVFQKGRLVFTWREAPGSRSCSTCSSPSRTLLHVGWRFAHFGAPGAHFRPALQTCGLSSPLKCRP